MVDGVIHKLKGLPELPFTSEDDPSIQSLLSHAPVAVECENSLWRARQMPDYGAALKPQKRLDGRPGLKKSAVLPTILLKEEDRGPLKQWQKDRGVPIHIWHAFFDEAFGISLQRAEKLITNGDIEATQQVFQAPGGATTRKVIYKIYYLHAYRLASTQEEPQLVAASITDKNGHILPYVRFVGGSSELCQDALEVLLKAAESHA
ncbi:MAG TPA: AccI family restriction endonuclease [Planctomycetota bacterium]|nr:AccI family restriction endonuclease [Planctomycetota bacterium]